MKKKKSSPISIHNELILEIFSRLPLKSVARFHCVSKLWASMFASQYFKELFLTRSLAKPRLLFAIAENGDENAESYGVLRFFSLPQLEHPYEKSSSTLVAAAEFHVKFSPDDLNIHHSFEIRYFSCGYASGLFYIHGDRYQARPLICNPITGRYAITPNRYTYRKAYSFFGFDPIDKQYKALSMAYASGRPGHHKILTFGSGDGDMTWRRIKNSLRYEIIMSDGVCINGVLYYLAGKITGWDDAKKSWSYDYMIACFDVRSEEFTFIDVERICELINYKGKLAMIYWEDDLDEYLEENLDDDATNELHVWVLKDVEKKEWSKYDYTCTDDQFFGSDLSIAGETTASGDIVFSMRKYTCKQPFYVFYFNLERKTLQRVEIQGFGEGFKKPCSVRTFVNHVEDLNLNDLELLKSFHPPLVEPEYFGPSDSESDSQSDSESDSESD